MAEFPALPIFTDALIADTVHLTDAEFGNYMRLLIFAWRTPDCRLPNSDLRLRTMLGMTPKRWASFKPVLMQFFIEDGDTLIQKKLTKVRRRVEEKFAQARKAGERSAAAKALRYNKAGSTGVTTGVSTDGQRGGQQPKPNISKDMAKDEFLIFWEGEVKAGKRVPNTALSANDVRAILKRGNVTAQQLKASEVQV